MKLVKYPSINRNNPLKSLPQRHCVFLFASCVWLTGRKLKEKLSIKMCFATFTSSNFVGNLSCHTQILLVLKAKRSKKYKSGDIHAHTQTHSHRIANGMKRINLKYCFVCFMTRYDSAAFVVGECVCVSVCSVYFSLAWAILYKSYWYVVCTHHQLATDLFFLSTNYQLIINNKTNQSYKAILFMV